tara:strand:- start:466 stop:750 length:285 start_codon:yes stop_codon:yes gene_type:complete
MVLCIHIKQTKEKIMVDQTREPEILEVQSRNKAVKFDREQRQGKIKSSLELNKETQSTILSMNNAISNDYKSIAEKKEKIKQTIHQFFSQPMTK